MYTNKTYNTRQSGHYNTPGTFVPAAAEEEPHQEPQPQEQPLPNRNDLPGPVVEDMKCEDVKMADVDTSPDVAEKPSWMKSNLAGVKKITNKERRRRQNETLRRLLSPKNALMVLNEMMPNAQVNNVDGGPAARLPHPGGGFCAALSLGGGSYRGYGDNKISARNAAAEQAFRDIVLARMRKLSADGWSAGGGDGADDGPEALPMIQLASFALHKLFAEWEGEGHRVPLLRPSSASVSEEAPESPAGKARKGGERALPPHAAAMHPCTLLTQMRPGLAYRELEVTGDHPPNLSFTMGVDVDGRTFSGKAGNKKEARRRAARAACVALFGVTFEDGSSLAAF